MAPEAFLRDIVENPDHAEFTGGALGLARHYL
jgi:hypothetical protein